MNGKSPLSVLLLEPFGDGSHAAFYRGWRGESAHAFTVLDLPAVHWKWRSRHASLTLAVRARALIEAGSHFDVVLCSDMLNLPEWRGLAGSPLCNLPSIVYFHENQFTYPLNAGVRRDYHYGFSNMLACIAADQVWFNSGFHLREFATAAECWLKRMPDFRHEDLIQQKLAAARICPPGIAPRRVAGDRRHASAESPLRIGWVARWEHDKRPDRFADVVCELVARQLPFQLVLLGQHDDKQHPSLKKIQRLASGHIRHAGYVVDQEAYWKLLRDIDVVISTADHEFFGVGIVEAVAAGAVPLLPQRLSYPEVFDLAANPDRKRFFYSGEAPELVERLSCMIRQHPRRLQTPAEYSP